MRYLLLLISFYVYGLSNAQLTHPLTIEDLHRKRIETNLTGMWVLGTWGVVNMGSGIIGALTTTNNAEVKAFHTMNALWSVVNTGIGVLGILRANKEKGLTIADADKYKAYNNTKKLYLINGGLDIVYIATGVILKSKSNNFKNPARGRGYGNSLVMQGIGLLVFDATMYFNHSKQNKYWKKAAPEFAVTDNGIGLVYPF